MDTDSIVDLTHEETPESEDFTDAMEMNTSAIIEESIPSIEDQRELISRMREDNKDYVKEGARLNVLPYQWFEMFMKGEFNQDPRNVLGQINTSGIRLESGVFCDLNHSPVVSVLPQIFDQLMAWYGLAPGCEPVSTVIIDNNGNLEPEFSRPIFHLHHLVPEVTRNSSYAQVIPLTMSQLNTCGDLIQHCIKLLDSREHLSQNSNFKDSRFRVWVVDDKKIYSLNYQLTPADFLGLKSKLLIRRPHLNATLKEVNLRVSHLVIEQKQVMTSNGKKEKYWPSNHLIHFPPTPSDGRVGLQNMGNTCYMNSALQCLVHIPELTQYFLFNCHLKELNTENPLGMGGKVAQAFAFLIHHLFDKKSSPISSYTPRDFKQVVGNFNNMFSGYHQQDSQEFLAFLLDGLHEDLNRIIQKPITENVELDENDVEDTEMIRELAQTSWKNHKLRNDSMIIDLFVGLYKSTLECPDCGKISITFDPFNDLTLPLPVENLWTGSIDLFLEEGPMRSFEVELGKTATYNTLKYYIASKLNLNPDHLFTAEIWNCQFYRNLEDSSSRSGYLPISDLISNGDKMVMYEVSHNRGDLIVPVLSTVNPPSNIPDAFGIPFFIALNEDERKSFGAIRRKLEHRYEQLSTFQYFSKVRANQDKEQFTAEDFPLLNAEERLDNDDDDISLANPEISGDYGFSIKLFDSSKEIRTRRRSFNRQKASGGSEDKMWTPTTNNNFTNLPDLLDSLSPSKRTFYTYAKRLDIDTTTVSNEPSEPEVPVESIEGPSLIEALDSVSQSLAGPEKNESKDESSSDINLEPLLHNLGTDELEREIDPNDGNGDRDVVILDEEQTVNDLIASRTALVCEWDPEHFDTFFAGLEDEDEGGKETWTTLEPLINEEVEESKKRRAEKRNDILSLDKCLNLFSKPEVLGEHDLWYCSRCKEHRQATKQIQIWSTPDILTIHLKRFESQRSFSDKIDAVVDFPIEGLDMSPYLASPTMNKDGVIYDLFAVDNHYGGIGGGHYTAYVKNFVDNKWYYFDDSRVRETAPEQSITGAAYLLFYRRRSPRFLGGDEFGSKLQHARDEYEENERLQLSELENIYHQNEDSSSYDEGEELDESDVEELDVDNNRGSSSSVTDPTPLKIRTDLEDNSSDNVSSIPVGTDDEDDLSNQRRKQRLLSRCVKLQSYVDSPALGSPANSNSNVSDDDCSTYSSTVNVPVGLQSGSLDSPKS